MHNGIAESIQIIQFSYVKHEQNIMPVAIFKVEILAYEPVVILILDYLPLSPVDPLHAVLFVGITALKGLEYQRFFAAK